jgi:hypothetical protein
MAQCPKCGANVPGKFCPNCGTQATPESQGAAAAMPTPPPPQPQGFPQPPQGFQPPQQPGYPPQPQVFQPGLYPGMQPVQQKSSVLKWVGIIVGVVALLLGGVVIASMGEDDTTQQAQKAVQSAIVSVGAPIFTDNVNAETQEPARKLQSIPTATDNIYAAVQVKVKKGQVLSAKWYFQGEHQPQLDTNLNIDEDFQGWGAFNIDNGGEAWPKGTLKVEIYLDDQLKQSANINIQ